MTHPDENKKGTYRSMTPGEIGAAVQQLREEMGWSQQMLAQRAGLHEHTVERVESCARVDEDCLRKIAQALGIPSNLFVRPMVYVASDDERCAAFERAWQNLVPEEPGRVSGLADCDAILTVRAYVFDPQDITPELEPYVLAVMMSVHKRTRDYLRRSEAEKREDCQSLLRAVWQFEVKGGCIQYVALTTEDQISLAVLRFLPLSKSVSKGAEPIPVPRRLKSVLDAMR